MVDAYRSAEKAHNWLVESSYRRSRVHFTADRVFTWRSEREGIGQWRDAGQLDGTEQISGIGRNESEDVDQ